MCLLTHNSIRIIITFEQKKNNKSGVETETSGRIVRESGKLSQIRFNSNSMYKKLYVPGFITSWAILIHLLRLTY